MLRYDQHPSRQKDLIAQRQAMLNTIVDFRFLTPYKIAADERCERELARSALSPAATGSAPAVRRRVPGSLRHRLGAALIAAGVWLQRDAVARLDPHPGS